jgi:hypothetical protein
MSFVYAHEYSAVPAASLLGQLVYALARNTSIPRTNSYVGTPLWLTEVRTAQNVDRGAWKLYCLTS